MSSVRREPPQLLLVEDSPGDIRLTREAFRDVNRDVDVYVVNDGLEALAFLHRGDGHAEAPRPDLILLDLNLPRMDGREVLHRIKQDAGLSSIPTVILTTSEDEVDIVKTYRLKANCYLNKPVELEAFEALVRSVNDFWLTKATLPSRS